MRKGSNKWIYFGFYHFSIHLNFTWIEKDRIQRCQFIKSVGGGGDEPTAWPPSAGSSKRTRKNTLNYMFFLGFRSLTIFLLLAILKTLRENSQLDKTITVEDIGYERGRRPSEFSLNMIIFSTWATRPTDRDAFHPSSYMFWTIRVLPIDKWFSQSESYIQ